MRQTRTLFLSAWLIFAVIVFPFASLLEEIEAHGETSRVTQQLLQARSKDPKAQLWPWTVVNALAYDHLGGTESKFALEILKLNFLAYPISADGASSLSDAYLANGEKDLARQYANGALALLDANINDSESDSPARRKLIRDGVLQNLKELDAQAASGGNSPAGSGELPVWNLPKRTSRPET
jgi:hypothetical protein